MHSYVSSSVSGSSSIQSRPDTCWDALTEVNQLTRYPLGRRRDHGVVNMKTTEKIRDGFEHVYYERIETRANIIDRLKPFRCHKDTTVGIEKGTDRE